MSLKWTEGKPLRILSWDIENRPLSYLGSDWTTAEITAIAAGWTDQERVHCWLLGKHTQEEMLTGFLKLFHESDCLTGHYIRKHDLPILNGALLEHKLPTLTPKLTSDTKMDLVRRKDLSASQESLAAMYDLPRAKHSMNQTQWREANRLTPEGLKQTRKRVVDDVRQHKQLRVRLLAAGALGPPKVWYP